LEDILLASPKTKEIATIMSQLNLENKKALVILPEYNDNVYLSTRNIPNVASTLLADINTYDIMNADVLVITESAAKIFNEEEAVA
jgi:large subunit ribosomal protein L4